MVIISKTSKPGLLSIVLPVLIIFLLFSDCKTDQDKHIPEGLMVDLLTLPDKAVITSSKPVFSWIIDDSRTGAKQTAWHIMVASSEEMIEKDSPDIWDSGKEYSDRSVNRRYGGTELKAGQTYWWKVRTWDQNNQAGRWSKPQKFHTGEFEGSKHKWPGESRWTELDRNGEKDYVFENRNPVRYHEIKPVKVVKNSAGNHFIKFEKAAFGALRLRLDSPERADTIIVHLGEDDVPGNQVNKYPGGSITYRQVKLALKPGKSDYLVKVPRFYSNYPNSQVLAEHMPEVTAFRYAEIEGWTGDLRIDNIRQLALLYHFDNNASYFYSSDDNLNQIWDLCKHTLRVTPFMGVYIDGGARERMPYEADAYVQQISHYSVDREFAIQRYTTNFLIFNPSWPTEWHLHIVLMAWSDYMATGNTGFLKRYYEELKKKTLLPLAREDGLISTRTGLVTDEFLESIHYHGNSFRDIVDWPQGTPANETKLRSGHGSITFEGETDRYIFSDINTVVNAFHYRNLVLMAKIASVLGNSEDEVFFRERSELVKASFNEKLLDKKTGLYRDGEGVNHSAFHANMFPVAFGLAPETNYPQLRKFLISKGMACSPYGTPYLFDALYKLNAEDYAYELLTSETDRSWMNMIRFGTTITSEAWDLKYKRNMTWNHAWGAAPAYIITRGVFGIEPLEPAFRTILIKPQPGALEHAEIRSPTIRGTIHARFKREPDGILNMEVTIPANTTARVILPKPEKENFLLKINNTETSFQIKDDRVYIDYLQSGKHDIKFH